MRNFIFSLLVFFLCTLNTVQEAPPKLTNLVQETSSLDFSSLYKKAHPLVCKILIPSKENPKIYETRGTGWLVLFNGKQKIITAYHVIQGEKTIFVSFIEFDAGKELKVEVEKQSPEKDIAILSSAKYPSGGFTLAKEILKVGQQVFLIGHPQGLSYVFGIGWISGTSDKGYIVQSAVFFGNSGGPVFNSKLELVGMVVGLRGQQVLGETVALTSYGLIISGDIIQTVLVGKRLD